MARIRLTMAQDCMPMKAASGGDTADTGLGLDAHEGSRWRVYADSGLGLDAYEAGIRLMVS